METKRPDYIEHGSAEHATFLGLRKAEKDDPYQYEGWAFLDPTQWGDRRPEYLQSMLRQKVNEWKTKPVVPKSAPPMWLPGDNPVTGVV